MMPQRLASARCSSVDAFSKARCVEHNSRGGQTGKAIAELAQSFPRHLVVGLRVGARKPPAVEKEAGFPFELAGYREIEDCVRALIGGASGCDAAPADHRRVHICRRM